MFKEELILIRHARSKYNVGESQEVDDGITDWGKKQAFNVGRFLATEMNLQGFEFYISPFLRCLETSSFIPNREPWRVHQGLREYLNHGGRSAQVPNRSDMFKQGEGRYDWGDYPAGGVTYDVEFNETFLHRMVETYHSLAHKSVVVTHGLPAFLLLYIGTTPNPRHVPVWDCSMDNCSITWIRKGQVIWHGKNLHHETGKWSASDRVRLGGLFKDIQGGQP